VKRNPLVPVGALAVLAAVLTGCTPSDGQSAAPAHPSTPPATTPTPTASGLSDPLESPLPLGTVILVQRSGSGPQTLDLSRLAGSAKAVQLRWICVGPGKFEISDGTRTLVGSDCSGNVAEASDIFGGNVPSKAGVGLAWKIEANSKTIWRLAATTAG
jgi:hypothetical protein